MNETLKKIKELLELSTEDTKKRDLLVGQAIGLIDSLVEKPVATNTAPFHVPEEILRNLEVPGTTMLDAVKRHKEVHSELSKDAVSKQNTQFKKL